MKEPEISFTEWKRWVDLVSLRPRFQGDEFREPGVYLLARFDTQPPTEEANLLLKEGKIVGIGETTKQTLRNRLNNFHCSAFIAKGSTNSSGGGTYYNEFLKNSSTPQRDNQLYVAVFPVKEQSKLKGEVRATFIKYVERKLIWEYTRIKGLATNTFNKPPASIPFAFCILKFAMRKLRFRCPFLTYP